MTDSPPDTSAATARTDPHLFDCCEHCGCGGPDGIWRERLGHDDTCSKGCNAMPTDSTPDTSGVEAPRAAKALSGALARARVDLIECYGVVGRAKVTLVLSVTEARKLARRLDGEAVDAT